MEQRSLANHTANSFDRKFNQVYFLCNDNGQYEFNVVPFGIKFASGLFNRVINDVLQNCRNFVVNFVDDLVVFSSNFKDHLYHVNLVLKKLYEARLTLNRAKCSFAKAEVKFLGFVVGRNTIRTDE
jgi:hypothetical protein